tara:strand:- start:2797 stop:3762 length:966 start_codon:yes stop_codon:yes gene_type:complete
LTNFLNLERNGKGFKVPVKILEKAEELKPLASANAWKVVGLLAEKPYYPAEIAKKLNLHEQKVYYYIKQLKKAGIIEVKKTEEKQGALAKYYALVDSAFALVPNLKKIERAKESVFFQGKEKKLDKQLEEFMTPFIHNGKLNCKIVIGSPDPHGPLKARARDGHLAVELAAFIGSLVESFEFPLVFLDTQVSSLDSLDENLIVVGGPITNKLCEELNEHLPIKFSPNGGHYLIKSELSGNDYNEDAIGVIEKVEHPFFKNKKILLVAGNRNAGTKAAIISLIKNIEAIIQGNTNKESVEAKVVEGLDLDGDGQIDNVEIKE